MPRQHGVAKEKYFQIFIHACRVLLVRQGANTARLGSHASFNSFLYNRRINTQVIVALEFCSGLEADERETFYMD